MKQLDDTFSSFLGLSPTKQHFPSRSSTISWRSLPLSRQTLHTGFSQSHDLSFDDGVLANQSEFFTTADVSCNNFHSQASGSDVLSKFYDHSLALHNSIPSSQMDSFDDTALDETSFMTASPPAAESGPVPSHLSDLEDIPSASRILSLNPQTVTLNLIVGIISIAQTRTVTTRWGRTLSLVEVLVGDNTKSGFAVTFWLARGSNDLRNLRRQDVVLMQNVALHVFRGKVYGQSLRKGMTKVNLLWRRDGSGQYTTRDLARRGQVHPQVAKTKQVKDWVLRFVGGGPGPRTRMRTRAEAAQTSWDKPPDDTQ